MWEVKISPSLIWSYRLRIKTKSDTDVVDDGMERIINERVMEKVQEYYQRRWNGIFVLEFFMMLRRDERKKQDTKS